MKLDLAPLYASTVGFDRFGSLLDAALNADRQVGGYPPYDIERLDEKRYSISVAVAGFAEDELDVQIKQGVLSIRGKKDEVRKDSRYLHRGIATRSFERTFNLADHVEVVDAQLDNGLLVVSLVREVPEKEKARRIPVQRSTQAIDSQLAEQDGNVQVS